MKKLLRNKKTPVYEKLKEALRESILDRSLKEGDPIPSERFLAEKFKISRMSVRKAISELISADLLYAVSTKGTFVKVVKPGLVNSGKKTGNIGFIFWNAFQSIAGIPYFSHFLHGAELEAKKYDYHLLMSTHVAEDLNKNDSLPSIITQKKVDGLVVEGIDLPTYRRISSNIPTVIISNYTRGSADAMSYENFRDVDLVTANDENGIFSLLQYLKELGHKKIGFIYQSLQHSSFYNRYLSFCQGIKYFSLQTRPEWIAGGDWPEEVAESVLNRKNRPEALIVVNDYIALRVMAWCHENGINVPGELSIAGFDDIQKCVWAKPALTTVRVLTEEMGRVAARRVFEKINNPVMASSHYYVNTSLVVRDSCMKIK
jgi:DNA-binding LacI/PurR family transcriptional regulator